MRTALVQSERAQAYLRERAIPLEIAQAAGVVYLPPSALRSPDLQAVAHALGPAEVLRRLQPLASTNPAP